jgi:hypothetical protein
MGNAIAEIPKQYLKTSRSHEGISTVDINLSFALYSLLAL